MRWTAIVPLKTGPMSKSRLANVLDAARREALGLAMARHVIGCLTAVEAIDRVLLLSPVPLELVGAEWVSDNGRGLNRELDLLLAHDLAKPHLLIHGDLPHLEPDDVAAMLDAAGAVGTAIAPDRHETGTNAIALATRGAFACAFGADSFALHREALGGCTAVVRRPGLAFDIDLPDDLAALPQGISASTGFLPPR